MHDVSPGTQEVKAEPDPGGGIACYAPPPKPCRGRYAREKSCSVEVVAKLPGAREEKLAEATFDYTSVPFWR